MEIKQVERFLEEKMMNTMLSMMRTVVEMPKDPKNFKGTKEELSRLMIDRITITGKIDAYKEVLEFIKQEDDFGEDNVKDEEKQ